MREEIKAGKAFTEKIVESPELQKGLARAQSRLAVFAKAVRLLSEIEKPIRAARAPEFRRKWEQTAKDWEAEFGLPYPKDLPEMRRLLHRAGIPFELVVNGELTGEDIWEKLEGYGQHLKDLNGQADNSPELWDLKRIAKECQRKSSRWIEDNAATRLELGNPDLINSGSRPKQWLSTNAKVIAFIAKHGPLSRVQ